MISRNILIVAILFIISAGGLIFWQKNDASISNPRTGIFPKINQETEQSIEGSTNNDFSFIENLRKREFKGGEITIEETVSGNAEYTSYTFSYPSDGLTIYGRMNVPKGNGPFPIIILNHGYFNQSSFQSGDGTQNMADILSRNGYLTVAPDYRGHGKSEDDGTGSRGHRPEYAIDVLNLIASIKSIEKADADRVGIWGHSMGGEVALRAVEINNDVKALVLWAPTTGRASHARIPEGGSFASTNISQDTSPLNFLQYITTPISLHQGLADEEVKPESSKELQEDLKKQGKKFEYFEYEGQDHNFINLGWDLISERTIAFYDKYLKR